MLKIKPLVNSQYVCYMIQKNQNPFVMGLCHLSKICTLEFTLNFLGFPYETRPHYSLSTYLLHSKFFF